MGYLQVVFSVTLEVKSCPPIGQERKTIKIKPVGLQDTLTVNVRIMCQCDCDSDQKMVTFYLSIDASLWKVGSYFMVILTLNWPRSPKIFADLENSSVLVLATNEKEFLVLFVVLLKSCEHFSFFFFLVTRIDQVTYRLTAIYICPL